MKSINVLSKELGEDLKTVTRENADVIGKKYLEYIELLFYMFLRDGDFYAYILIQLNRKINFFIKNPAAVRVNNQKVTLTINPLLFHKFNFKEQKAILEHECLHVLNNHVPRLEPLLKLGHKKRVVNVAADLVVNQFIKNLPPTSLTLENVGEQLSIRLPRNLTVENYLYLLEKRLEEIEKEEEERRKQEEQEEGETDDYEDEFDSPNGSPSSDDKNDSSEETPNEDEKQDDDFSNEDLDDGDSDITSDSLFDDVDESDDSSSDRLSDIGDDPEDEALNPSNDKDFSYAINEELMHDEWLESESDSNFEDIPDIIESIIEKASEKCDPGKIPGHVKEILNMLHEPPIITWQMILRHFVGTIPTPFKNTITRLNRRLPHRLDLKGRLSKFKVKIKIVIDTSGSMSSKELKEAFSEIVNILQFVDYEIEIIEVDTVIQRTYKVKKDSELDFSVQGRGGTYFSPAFKYINETERDNAIIIFFTDGMGEQKLTHIPAKRFKLLWVITTGGSDISLSEPYGTVKKLKYEKSKNQKTFA